MAIIIYDFSGYYKPHPKIFRTGADGAVNFRLPSVGAGYIRPGGTHRFELRAHANS